MAVNGHADRRRESAEKPEIIVKAQRARCEARRQQLAAIIQDLKAAREAQSLSLADIYEPAGMDRPGLSKLENVTIARIGTSPIK